VALDAGRQTYSEKPLDINFVEGRQLADAAMARACALALLRHLF
jgi:predicted dehydrogenase